MDAIATETLTKSYGRARGVVELTLAVPVGTIFGFLGPNGAGKTTTIRILLDLLRPTSGHARVLGLDSRADAVEIHRRTGYLPGDPALYDRITGRELLEWLARLRGGVDHTYLAGLVERFDVDMDREIRHLSRGNRQKIAVVQAFMHRPELLVLDEPTSGLDPLVQHEFQELCREVTGAGATVFLSSHVLDEVQHLCEHVAIIRDGSLVASEDVDALRERAVRDVSLRFAGAFDAEPFAALPGVQAVAVDGPVLHLQLSGDADALVKLAARYDVVDFESAPADLDVLFLHYYEGSDGDGAADR
jgi:beta-exotoxin I transport system ATP-binding protein